MITEGNFRLTGLKERNITSDIQDIIDKAKEFLVICGYGFTSHKNDKSILKKIIESPITRKHCILPIALYRNKEANKSKAKILIENGISISIEASNHSKWLLSEKEIYYGSANFSIDSLENKIEVATFRNFIKNDPLKNEFLNFINESMNRMVHSSDRRHIWGYIKTNQDLTKQTKPFVLRLNPSIQKVYTTLDSINMAKTNIYELIENSFWYLDDKSYYRLINIAGELDEILKDINYYGISLIEENIKKNSIKTLTDKYNAKCDFFLNNIEHLSNLAKDFYITERTLPPTTKKNRLMVKENISIIKKHL